MSLKSYRWLDIAVFSAIAMIFEVVNHFASTSLAGFQLVFMSFTIVLSLIEIYRWGFRGSLVAALGAIAGCAIANGTFQQYYSYLLGNTIGVILGALIFQVGIGRANLMKHKILLFIYLLSDFIIVVFLRCLIISFGAEEGFFSSFVLCLQGEAIQEAMSILTSAVILGVASRKKSQLMVEMVGYIRKVQDDGKLGNLKEIKESPKFNADQPFTKRDEIDNGNILDGGFLSQKQLDELDAMSRQKAPDEDPIDVLTSKK